MRDARYGFRRLPPRRLPSAFQASFHATALIDADIADDIFMLFIFDIAFTTLMAGC